MTLHSPGAPGADAPAQPRDVSDRPAEAHDEGLRVLEALLAESSAVSSEEAGNQPGLTFEPSSREIVLGEGAASERSCSDRVPQEDPLTAPEPGTHLADLQPASEPVPEAGIGASAGTVAANSLTTFVGALRDHEHEPPAELDDGIARWGVDEAADDASSVPAEPAALFAGPATPEESAGRSAVWTKPSYDKAEADDLPVVRAATWGTVGLETTAASSTEDLRDGRDDAPGERIRHEAAVSAGVIAPDLDDVLIRNIAETLSVSSDSPPSGAVGAAALAAEPRDAGVEHLRERSSGLLTEADSHDADTAAAVEAPSRGAAGEADYGESAAASRAGLEAAAGMVIARRERSEAEDGQTGSRCLEARGDSEWNAAPIPKLDEPGLWSSIGESGPGEAVAGVTADSDDAGAGPAIGVPSLGDTPLSSTGADGTLVREILDVAADPSSETAEPGDVVASGTDADAAAHEPKGVTQEAEEAVTADWREQDVLKRHESESEPTTSADARVHEACAREELSGSSIDGPRADKTQEGDASGDKSRSGCARAREDASPIICLPDQGGTSTSEAAAEVGASPERHTADVAAYALGDPAEPSSDSVKHAGHIAPALDAVAGPGLVDALLRDMTGTSVSSDQIVAPGTAVEIPVPDGDSDVDAGRPADPIQSERLSGPDAPESVEEPADCVADLTRPPARVTTADDRSEYEDGLLEAKREDSESGAEWTANRGLDERGDPRDEAGSVSGSDLRETEPFSDRIGADEASVTGSAGIDAGVDDAETGDDAGSVIHLPDLSGPPPTGVAARPDDVVLRQIAEVVTASAGETVGPSDLCASGRDDEVSARDPVVGPEPTEEASSDDARRENPNGTTLAEPRGLEDGIDPIGIGGGGEFARVGTAESGLFDTLLRDVTGTSPVSSDQADRPDYTAGAAVSDVGSVVDADLDVAQRTAGLAASSPEGAEEPGMGVAGEAGSSEGAVADSAQSEGLGELARVRVTVPDDSAEMAEDERFDEPDSPKGEASWLPASALSEAEPSIDPDGPGEASIADSTADAAGADASEAEEDVGSVIHLPDLSGVQSLGPEAGQNGSRLRQITDVVAASSGEALEAPEAALSGSGDAPASDPDVLPATADGAAREDSLAEDADVIVLPGSDEFAASVRAVGGESRDEPGRWPEDLADEAETDVSGIVFDDTLALDLAAAAPVSSSEGDAPEPAFDAWLPDAQTAASDASGERPDSDYSDGSLEAAPPGPAAALAFATDADTEMALRDGLFGFGGGSAGTDEAQVWQGGLRAAIAALAEGRSAPLIFADIDGLSYPAGAIHELAAVCEVGTVVIAVGSDDSARPGRELLLAGVSDYLAKPLTAEAVRGVAGRALADSAGSRPGGLVASFAGCGGSGATTMATAAALQAAARGCYVSVLDLSRSVPAAALALGVDPVAGLDQLLETAAREAVEPEALEGVCARRSDRIEVYAHRWSPEHPAAASVEAVDSLLAVLRLRSQMVVVDGLDEALTRFLPAAEIDTRVFVAEPTAGKTPQLARMGSLLNGDRPLVLVQNHTRAFRRNGGGRTLRDAGIGIEPDVLVPFDPALPEAVDWGWPGGRLPRSVRKPVTALTDRLLGASTGAAGAEVHASARAA